MSRATRISTPGWVRIDAAAPAPWVAAAPARVTHAGRSCVVLEDAAGRMLVVSSTTLGLTPGGVQLLDADLLRFMAATRAGFVDLSAWEPATVVAADLTLRRTPVSAAAIERLGATLAGPSGDGGPMDPGPIRDLATTLATDAVAGRDPDRVLTALIGAGPGSTPTGDDVVVGALAGLRATGALHAAVTIGAALGPMLQRTTASSAHYLAAAVAGRFADRVHDLVAGLGAPDRADRAARLAARFGATSGLDLLAGLLAAARATNESRTSERLTA